MEPTDSLKQKVGRDTINVVNRDFLKEEMNMNLLGVGIYVKNSPKAIEMYCSAFGLEIGYHVLNDNNTY